MEALRTALQKSDQSYWASRTEEQMQAVSAWIALAEGNRAQAEKLMRTAADSEDGPKGFGAHSDQERILESELFRFVRFNWDAVLDLARAR